MREGDEAVSGRAELAGWLAFLLAVFVVWRLRERLNRSNG
jgi:hypothetical protein